MAFSPSVGDILMLSQTAWKIGRAFTQGKKSAPAEFAEVEREADGLSEALKLVAETLHADDGSILSQADETTQLAVSTILESAHKTLGDLESFVERYRVIKRKDTNGGFVVERSWSEVVIANYKTLKWTTEGGDLSELRDMLHMHTNTINLTMQALQSRSLARLERTVVPMAENVASIHDRVTGDLGDKIDDLHRIIMALANNTPSLQAQDRRARNSVASSSTVSTIEAAPIRSAPRLIEPPPRHSSFNLPIQQNGRRISNQSSFSAASSRQGRQEREDSGIYNVGNLSFERDKKVIDWTFESGSPPSSRSSIGGSADVSPDPLGAASPGSFLSPPAASSSSSRRSSNAARRESTTLPMLMASRSQSSDDAEEGSSRQVSNSENESPVSPRSKHPTNSAFQRSAELPPPAMSPDSLAGIEPATPSSIFASLPERAKSSTNAGKRPSTASTARKRASSKSQASPTNPGAPNFEKSLFRNAAILTDVRCKMVELARYNPDETDVRFATEMVPCCTEGRICVVRKREHRPHGGTQVSTSVWAISDDGEIRCQQKLPDDSETVPFCSYFQPEKVSLPPVNGGELTLAFHSEEWGAPVEREVRTNWVNYIFESEEHANQFQSAIFGRSLLGSYRTTKTTVLHDGFKGSFAFEEQFANIEVLRLWEDDGTALPGAQQGVLALMHFASNFSEGWAKWWMNSSKQHVRVKEDPPKHAKLKGIDITAIKPGANASVADRYRSPATAGEGLQRRKTSEAGAPKKKAPEKKVTGVRIEFRDEEERNRFVALTKRLQERMLPLPDL